MAASQSDHHKTTNDSKPQVKEFQDEVPIVWDQQLEVLPTNEKEEKEEIPLTTAAVAIEPTKTKVSSTKAKSSSAKRRRDEISSAEIRKQLERQRTQIEKVTIMLHSIQKDIKSNKGQIRLISQPSSQIKRVQNQLSQIQKHITKKSLAKSTNKNPKRINKKG
jgi:hypothetical protein